MDWKKIAPWNWFKEEEAPAAATQTRVPVDVSSDPGSTLRTEVERLFDDTLSRVFPRMPGQFAAASRLPMSLRPKVDIAEGKKAYTVRAELPGVELADVSIEVEGQTLVIRAEKRHEIDEEHEGYHCVERSYGAAQRVRSLPHDADGQAIEAKFKNGVLKLRIPKRAVQAPGARSIEIEGD